MSTRTTTRTSTALTSHRTRDKSLERFKPFNKRPTKSDHVQAPATKVRKLSSFSAEMPAKVLASALKRRQESVTLSKVPPVPVVPANKSPAKVRFLGQDSTPSRRRSSRQHHEDSRTSGDVVQVVVPIPRPLEEGSTGVEDRRKSPQRKTGKVTEDDETDDIVTTQVERRPQHRRARDLDADFESRYFELKDLAWAWVVDYVADVGPEAKKSLGLVDLARSSPQLMEYANGLSCCAQKQTWEDVFNEQRAQLVYCILGKVLEVHVFSHEMFGADKEQLRELRELDAELANKDGFYRQRCRAHRILAFLPDPSSPTPQFHRSITLLHASITEMLSPLLPTPPPPDLQPSLLAILLKAASLSLSMRRERTVLYHWEPHPALGSLFEEKRMHILNAIAHKEADAFRRNTDSEVVTMAGWPSCIAYRPGATTDGQTEEEKKKKKKKQPTLGITRIDRAEVCVTFGPAVKPTSVEPENWLGKSLRAEMTEREQARGAAEKTAAVARRAAGLGMAAWAALGARYVVANPWIRDEVVEYLGSFV